MSVDSHSRLIRRIAEAADRQAFAVLFTYFAPRVKTYMRRLGAADRTAEDLAQETMLAVWRKAALFDPSRAAASTWIFTIARNLRFDAQRRSRPTEPLPGEYDQVTADDRPAADALLALADRDERLRLALHRLPATQAKLVQLAFFEDRPHREIERMLDMPLGTVKSRLRAAMHRLRACLGDEA